MPSKFLSGYDYSELYDCYTGEDKDELSVKPEDTIWFLEWNSEL